jgi:hypothetical protein
MDFWRKLGTFYWWILAYIFVMALINLAKR